MSRWPCLPKPVPGATRSLLDDAGGCPIPCAPDRGSRRTRERVMALEPAVVGVTAVPRSAQCLHGGVRDETAFSLTRARRRATAAANSYSGSAHPPTGRTRRLPHSRVFEPAGEAMNVHLWPIGLKPALRAVIDDIAGCCVSVVSSPEDGAHEVAALRPRDRRGRAARRRYAGAAGPARPCARSSRGRSPLRSSRATPRSARRREMCRRRLLLRSLARAVAVQETLGDPAAMAKACGRRRSATTGAAAGAQWMRLVALARLR